MKRSKPSLLTVLAEADLKQLIEEAADRTHLSQRDVMRSALRLGVPELVKRLEVGSPPRRNLMDYVDAFRGLVQPMNHPGLDEERRHIDSHRHIKH